MNKDVQTHEDIARKGGFARRDKTTPEQRKEWAEKGGSTTKQKYGAEHFKRIRQIGIEKSRQRKIEEAKSTT